MSTKSLHINDKDVMVSKEMFMVLQFRAENEECGSGLESIIYIFEISERWWPLEDLRRP